MKALLDAMKAHPVMTGVLVACTAVGTIAGALYLPAEWHAIRRLAAGGVSGAGCGLIIVATRLVGP